MTACNFISLVTAAVDLLCILLAYLQTRDFPLLIREYYRTLSFQIYHSSEYHLPIFRFFSKSLFEVILPFSVLSRPLFPLDYHIDYYCFSFIRVHTSSLSLANCYYQALSKRVNFCDDDNYYYYVEDWTDHLVALETLV
jgi:hypothetical protein